MGGLFRGLGFVRSSLPAFRQRKRWLAAWRLHTIAAPVGPTTVAAIVLLVLATILALVRLLGLGRGHNAVVMLRVLQIILCGYPVARGIGIARQLKIFLVDMRRRAANLHLGAVRIEGSIRVVILVVRAMRPSAALP